jgi:Ca2+-binding RTX toxin-like protein
MGAYERDSVSPTGIVFAGTPGPDAQLGTDGADVLCGYAGVDDFNGLGGPDFLDGGDDADVLGGFGGRDRMFGRQGADILCGADGSGRDLLDGGIGTDSYDADPGDTLVSVEVLFRPCHD